MKVINPTKKTIRVQIEGSIYEVNGEDSLENVPKAHADHWKAQIHNFIGVQEDTVKVIPKEIPIEKPKVEEKKEEVKEVEVKVTPKVVKNKK